MIYKACQTFISIYTHYKFNHTLLCIYDVTKCVTWTRHDIAYTAHSFALCHFIQDSNILAVCQIIWTPDEASHFVVPHQARVHKEMENDDQDQD